MRRIILILALAFYLSGLAAAAAETPKTGADGSLVLEGGKEAQKGKASGDTLYDLLGQEVQVYIYQ